MQCVRQTWSKRASSLCLLLQCVWLQPHQGPSPAAPLVQESMPRQQVLPGHIDLLKGLRHVPPSTGNQQPLLGQQAAGSGTSSMACVSGLCKDNPKLQQALRQDLMREDDCRAMDVLIARLDAMRNPAGPAQQQPRAAVPPGAARPPSASSSVKSSWAARPGRPRSSSVPRRRMTK